MRSVKMKLRETVRRITSLAVIAPMLFSGAVFADTEEKNADITITNPIGSVPSATVKLSGDISGCTIEWGVDGENLQTKKITADNETIDFNIGKNSFKNIVVRVKDGSSVINEVNAEVSYVPFNDENPLDALNKRGFSTHFMTGNTRENLALLKKMGVKTIRDEVGWSMIEHRKGVYNFSGFNTTYPLLAADYGIEIIICLDYYNDLYVTGAIDTDSEREAYANYCKAVAKQYPEVTKFEIWNEPNLWYDWNWHQDPTDYVKMLETASAAIRSVNPDATVIGGSFSDYQGIEPYYNKFYAMDNVYASADAISIHPYWYYSTTPQSVYESRLMLHNSHLSARGGFKDLYITELGFPSYSDSSAQSPYPQSISEEEQAADIIKSFALGDYYNVEKFMIYDFKNDGDSKTNREYNFGVITNDDRAKKAYAAINEMNGRISGAPYMGVVTSKTNGAAKSEEIHMYNVDGTPVAIAWYNDSSNRKATKMHWFGNSVDVYDMYGNLKSKGVRIVTLTSEPVYIYGLSSSEMYKSARGMAQSYMNAANTAASNLSGAQAASVQSGVNEIVSMLKSTVDNSSSAKAIYDKIAELGNNICSYLKDGKITSSEKAAGTVLDHMSNAAENILKIYADTERSDSGYVISSSNSLSKCTAVKKSDNEVAKAILKRAEKYNEKAEKLAAVSGLNTKYGMTAANDMMSDILVNWINILEPHIDDKSDDEDEDSRIKAKFDDDGYLTVFGKTDKKWETVTVSVLKPSANGEFSPSGLDYIDQTKSGDDKTFAKKYLSSGEMGTYKIFVYSNTLKSRKATEATFYTANGLLELAKKLKESKSEQEAALIMESSNSGGIAYADILGGFSDVFSNALADNMQTAKFGECIYRRKDEIDTENIAKFTHFASEVAAVCVMNSADSDKIVSVIEKYAEILNFSELNAYKTYLLLQQPIKDMVHSKLANCSFDTAAAWRDAFANAVILTAIEQSNQNTVYDIIVNNNDNINISFDRYNSLSSVDKYRVLSYFSGVGYSNFAAAKAAFDKAVSVMDDKSALNAVGDTYVSAARAYTDDAYTFRFKDDMSKTFIMLDKDEKGDMFVLAKDSYGKRAYASNENRGVCSRVKNEDGTWTLNYGGQERILSWLDGDFIENGNTYKNVNYRLPDGVVSNLVNTDWKFEPLHSITDSICGGVTVGQQEMTARVSLLSATEYLRYKDIIGYSDDMDTSADYWSDEPIHAWYLRTQPDQKYLDTVMTVIATNDGGLTPGMLFGGAFWNYVYPIRPCFYLDKEFVLKSKLDTESMGGAVKKYIRENFKRSELETAGYTQGEISDIYNVTEMQIIGFDLQNTAGESVENVVGGSEVSGVYTVENNVDYATYATAIIAVYDANTGKFVGASTAQQPTKVVSGGLTKIKSKALQLPENISDLKIKCFIWTDLGAITPYSAEETIKIQN